MFLVVLELADVRRACGVGEGAVAAPASLDEVALVRVSGGEPCAVLDLAAAVPSVRAAAVREAVAPLAVVRLAAVEPGHAPEAVLAIVRPLAVVAVAARVHERAAAVLLVARPLAVVATRRVGVEREDAAAVAHAVAPLAVVPRGRVREAHHAAAVAKAAADLALVPRAVGPGVRPVALRDVVAEVALEDDPVDPLVPAAAVHLPVLEPAHVPVADFEIRLALALVQAKLGDRAAVGADRDSHHRRLHRAARLRHRD